VNNGKFPIAMGLADDKGFPHEGSLDFAAITLDPSTGTLLLRGIFPNPDNKLLPGLFARVRIPLSQKRPSLLVPQVAVSFDQQGPYVLIVNDKNLVERRPIKTGPQVDNLRVVEEGLTGDEWVITKNLIRAIPGRPVKPERQEPGASGSATPAPPKP
jgi:RND family efflux transporter MFP subunit